MMAKLLKDSPQLNESAITGESAPVIKEQVEIFHVLQEVLQ